MFLISNNGNLNGKNTLMENNPLACDDVRHMGYDVKIDVWLTDKGWFLGKEKPQFSIEFEYLLRDGFWCQAKNIGALREMIQHEEINCFWHQQDEYTLTSKGYIWTYPGKPLTHKSICVLPELLPDWRKQGAHGSAGICSDFVQQYDSSNSVWENEE